MERATAPAEAGAVTYPHLPAKVRLAMIKDRIRQLQNKAPDGWDSWSHERVVAFKCACILLITAGSLKKALPPAEQIAKEYGRTLAEIDPCFGEAA